MRLYNRGVAVGRPSSWGGVAVDTGLIIIGLLYVALSVWAIANLFMRRQRARGG
jgi:hypothetical protein